MNKRAETLDLAQLPVEAEAMGGETRHLQLWRGRVDGREVLRCSGEIDISNVGWLTRTLAACSAAGISELELDLLDVEFLDSVTMLAVAEAHRKMTLRGQRLTVRAADHAARLFRMARLENLFAA